MQEDFDRWNRIKRQFDLEENPITFFPKESEVWLCYLGKNIGFEQDGIGRDFLRPALVIKKFNNQMFWVVPLSTKQKNLDFYYNFVDRQNQKVSAILAQLRLVSTKRFKRKLYQLDEAEFLEINRSLKNLLL